MAVARMFTYSVDPIIESTIVFLRLSITVYQSLSGQPNNGIGCPVSNVGMGSVGMCDGMLDANRCENRFGVDAAVALGEGDNNDHGIDMSSELGYPVNI